MTALLLAGCGGKKEAKTPADAINTCITVSVSEAVSVAASLLTAVVVVEEAVPQAVNEAARLSATADLATRRFDLFIVILLLFERFAAHRQLLSVLWCLLLVSESFTITSQVGVKADPQDNSNIYVETVSKFCRNCVNYTKLLYSSLFFLIFFSKM